MCSDIPRTHNDYLKCLLKIRIRYRTITYQCYCIQYANKRRKKATFDINLMLLLAFSFVIPSNCRLFVCLILCPISLSLSIYMCYCLCVLKLSRRTKLCDCCNSSLALHWKFNIEHMFWNVSSDVVWEWLSFSFFFHLYSLASLLSFHVCVRVCVSVDDNSQFTKAIIRF